MSTTDPTRLAAAIAAAIADEELLAALDTVLERAGRPSHLPYRWDAGGCLILAEAVRRVAGGTLVGAFEEGMIADDDGNDFATDSLDHVLAELPGGLYADALGVRDLDAALDDVVEIGGFEAPVLVPLEGSADPLVAANSIPYDEPLATRLATFLAARLG